MAVVYSIIAFLIGLLVGWLVWGRRGPSAASAPVPAASVTTPVAEATPAEPRPHLSAGAVEETPEPVAEPAAEPRPHVSGGAVEDPDPEPTPRPHIDPGATDEPTPRPHISVGAVEDEPVAEPEPVATEPVPAPFAAEPVAEPEPEPTLAPVAAEPVTVVTTLDAEAPAATVVPAQRNGVAGDDLKRIEGIGPKMAAALNAAGITTFTELAETDEPTIRAAITKAGMRFSPTLVTWPRQARLLADGDLAGFAALTRTLKGAKA